MAAHGGPQTARAVFDKYDTNRDGVLDQDEVAAMIDSIGYEVDASYVSGVMEIFRKFDTDHNGTIELAEFPQLWEHLGGEALVVETDDTRATASPAPTPQHVAAHGGPQTARAVFDKYDTNRDGVLDQDEVAAMIDSIGYEVDASYVGGVMEIFGKFDTDHNGTIEMAEFPQLWEHLGGESTGGENRDQRNFGERPTFA